MFHKRLKEKTQHAKRHLVDQIYDSYSKGLLVEKALPNIRLELMDQSQPGTRPPTISRRLL